jgi:hypothetical protein
MNEERRDDRHLRLVETSVAMMLVAMAVVLHVVLFLNAGPLWRDEINSAYLQSLQWRELWGLLQFDSFPMGWFVTLKCWTGLFGEAAGTYRVFGLLAGLTVVTITVICAWRMSGRPPLLTLALLLLNGTVIRFGDSVRGYGMGMLLAVLVYWAGWRYVRAPSRGTFLTAIIAAVAAVQMTYHNAVVVFAVCTAAMVVLALRKETKAAAGILAVGGLAAATLLPYLVVFRSASVWGDVQRIDLTVRWLYQTWLQAIMSSGIEAVLAWNVAIPAAILASVLRIGRQRWREDPLLPFHWLVLIILLVAYVAFFFALSWLTAPWYYLTLMAVAALSLECIIRLTTTRKGRWAVVLVSSLLATMATAPAARYVSERATNADLVASNAAALATRDDFIVVGPWVNGISFAHYYSGQAPWSTLPPVTDLRIHRFDLYSEAIATTQSTFSVFRLIDWKLAEGHRVLAVRDIGYAGADPFARTEPDADFTMAAFDQFLRTRGYQVRPVMHAPDAARWERLSLFEIVLPQVSGAVRD